MKTENQTATSYPPKKPTASYIMYRNDKIRYLNKKEEYENLGLFEINKKISQMWKKEELFVKEFYKHKYSVKQANYFKQKETFEKKQIDFFSRNKKISKNKKSSIIKKNLNFQIKTKKETEEEKKEDKITILEENLENEENRLNCELCEKCNFQKDPVFKDLSFLNKKKINLSFFFRMVNKDFVIKLKKDETNGELKCF